MRKVRKRERRLAIALTPEVQEKFQLAARAKGFTVSGAIKAALAEAEAEALRERTVAGLRNARAKGKRLGRPPLGEASVEQILALKGNRVSQEQIARRLGVSTAYVSRKLAPYKTSSALAP